MDKTQDNMQAAVWLSMADGVTSAQKTQLIRKYGGAAHALRQMDRSDRAMLGEKQYAALKKAREDLQPTLDKMNELSIQALIPQDNGYPLHLSGLADAPQVLYVMGTIPTAPTVAIVGSRHDTRYGREMAEKIARDLANMGVVVVSGLARGIDTAAHRGAVQTGRTVAVLGCGLDITYPPENRPLAETILSHGGALVSEYPVGAAPISYHFPLRNRIISGLSDAVLLIEATLRSGTMSTVNHALRQGRQVFALPGNVDAPGSELPLKLLHEGAHLCTCAEDIVKEMFPDMDRMPIVFPEPQDSPLLPDDPVLQALAREEKTFEELLAQTGLSVNDLTCQLTILEMEGKVERRAGRAYALKRS